MKHEWYEQTESGAHRVTRVALVTTLLVATCACAGQQQGIGPGGSVAPGAPPAEQSTPRHVEVADSQAQPAAPEASTRPPSADETPAAGEDAGRVVYRAELEQPLSLQQEVGHLSWTCRDGSCSARGPELNVSGKSCVQLGATLGSVVKSFEYDGKLLEGRHLEYCQTTLRKLDADGKLAQARASHERAEDAPKQLARGEKYVEITVNVGQMRLRGDELRFAFPDGGVTLVTKKGAVYRFDAERRLIEHGRFKRWYSVRGHYVSEDVSSDAILERCSRTNGGVVIQPWEIHHSGALMPACYPHREDFRLIFREESNLDPKEEAAVRAAVYAAPYAQDRGWKTPRVKRSKTPIEVEVGSARSVPGYHKQPARDMLEKVQKVVEFCARYQHDPGAETKGVLVLSLDAFGKPKAALVRRTTYPEPERMSTCIEQRMMREKFQTTYDVVAQVPFRIVER